ncbi:MAG TPA: ATP-binding protein [Cerasibacillus sp.]|uniref:sensor histidine kinase n=1 Tax=Cerasibacillus sp. TaxID=2498711 RepID=UPI002F40855D
MKLKTKIQLFSSLFMILLLLIINAAIYILFYKTSSDGELEELLDQTNIIATALNESDDVLTNDLLRAFLPSDGMIRIINDDSTFIHQLTRKKDYLNQEVIYTDSEIKNIYDLNGEKMAVVSKPIIWEDGQVVTLEVSKHLVILEKNMSILFYVLIIAAVFMLIPTMLASKMLSGFLLRPIHEFIKTMNENMTAKKWQRLRLKKRSKDEMYEMGKTFNHMITKLEENFHKQEAFVSDASHELKTPIAIIKSYAQLLKRRGLEHPDIFTESVDAIHSESDRMQKLVEQLLLLAKNEANVLQEKVNFNNICENIVHKISGVHSRELRLSMDKVNIVRGNKEQLQQIVYILIMNALKYSEREIDIRLYSQTDDVIFQVEDYGIGISKKDQDRIFDRFYRVDKARSRDSGGTGLGLAIAKEIAELHGGTLSVESEKDKGSIFTLKLPKYH